MVGFGELLRALITISGSDQRNLSQHRSRNPFEISIAASGVIDYEQRGKFLFFSHTAARVFPPRADRSGAGVGVAFPPPKVVCVREEVSFLLSFKPSERLFFLPICIIFRLFPRAVVVVARHDHPLAPVVCAYVDRRL